ncbi:restriction endonuclease subunit S [Agrobacterium deltaense]
MHKTWRDTTWGEEVTLNYGKAIRGYQDKIGPYRVYGSNGAVGWHTEMLANGPGVILGRKGAYRGVRYSRDPFFVIDTAYYLTPKAEMNMRWLYYAVIHHRLGEIDDGSPIPSTTRAAVYVCPVQIPPLCEQEHIADVLGSLDDKIELNRRMNETLEAMAQAIFRDWFVDFGPTRRKLEGATDPLTIMGDLVQDVERAQALADLFPDALGDDGLPEGWREKQLGSLVVLLKRGLTPSYCDGGVPVINQKCIRNGHVNFAVARRHDSVKRPPKERALQEEDVLVNSTGVGTLGRVATVRGLKEEATADSHVTICRADADRISKLVFSLFVEGQQSLIETMGHGSTGQTELSPSSLAALRIPVAPSQIQKAFDAIAEPLRSKVTANAEQSLTLAATRDLLLPKLMSGEIRLSEAEGLMEAAQ